MATRREAIGWLGLGSLGALATCGGRAVPAAADAPADEDALDHALLELHRREPLARGGLSSHASMVAETLCELGRPEDAVARVERDRAELIELPRAREPIAASRWRAALGRTANTSVWERNVARYGDWTAFFASELADDPWRVVLARWLGRLLPGAAAAATHGPIRTAHAVRSLERRESEARVAELARGLAYWAAAYQELPAAHEPMSARTGTYTEAIESVPRWSDSHRDPPLGNIVAGLDAAATVPGLANAIAAVETPSDPEAGFADLTATAARLYLQHGTRHHGIAFVHAVTGPCALRRLLPYVPPDLASDTLAHAWSLVAAIHAAYARRDDVFVAPEAPAHSREDLVARAIDAGDDHAIKLTEALLWSHAQRPDTILLAAAARAVP